MPDFAALNPVPLIYAVLLAGLVGLEREIHGRPAGLRTHILVCLSSTMLILVSHDVQAGAIDPGSAGRLVLDPNRMGAGIVTGIGFLGAATVLRSGDLLRGLTTAACIWFVAGLGIVLGNQNYALGAVATAIVLIVLTLVNWISKSIPVVTYRRLVVVATTTDADALMRKIREALTEDGMRVLEVSSGHDRSERTSELDFHVALKKQFQMPRLTEKVARIEGVSSARWRPIH